MTENKFKEVLYDIGEMSEEGIARAKTEAIKEVVESCQAGGGWIMLVGEKEGFRLHGYGEPAMMLKLCAGMNDCIEKVARSTINSIVKGIKEE